MTTTSWFVGSHGSWPSSTVTISGTDYEIAATVGTGMYPYHTTAGLNWMAKLKAHLDTKLGGTNVVRLNKSGRMFISASSGVFTLAWTDTLNRDFSGFTQGNLAGASSYTADDVSPWLFSPARNASPLEGRLGSSGRPIYDVVGGVSRDGTVAARMLGEQVVERLWLPLVPAARWQDSSDTTIYFRGWWANVGARGRRFFHWLEIDEDTASTSAVTWTTGLGPYCVDLAQVGGRLPGKRTEHFGLAEAYYDLEIPCHIAPEYV